MSLRHLTGIVAVFLGGLVTAVAAQQTTEPQTLPAAARKSTSVSRAPTGKSATSAKTRPRTGTRLDQAGYDQPTPAPKRYSSAPAAQRRLSQLPRSKTPTDAPRDLFEDTDEPATPGADEPAMDSEPAAEADAPAETETPAIEPEKPSDDMFDAPAATKPSDDSPVAPLDETPTKAPAKSPSTKPRQTTPPRAAPSRPAPSRSAPSRPAPTPPPYSPPPSNRGEYVPTPAPHARPGGPSPVPEEQPYEGEFVGEFGDAMECEQCGYGECQSCEQALAGGGGYWDSYCPPPLNRNLFRGTWVSVDYLMWWSRGASLPPLVTTGVQHGALNDPALGILVGDTRVDNGIRSGGRVNVGTWLNPDQTFGIGASFVDLQNMATNFAVNSPGAPLIARPFVNASTATDDSIVIASPGQFSGTVTARTTNSFIGFDTFFRRALAFGPGKRLDILYGYQYLQLSDSLDIRDQSISTDPTSPVFPLGTVFNGQDQFRAANRFNGFELGLMSERRRGIWSLATTGKVGLGNMHQTVIINGSHAVIEPTGPSANGAGDVLTQPSNIGRYDRNTFSAVPQAMINLGCQITPRLRANFGYSIIYIGNVAQAARQIDPTVDPNQFNGASGKFPAFSWQQNSFWLQGLNFGLNYQY